MVSKKINALKTFKNSLEDSALAIHFDKFQGLSLLLYKKFISQWVFLWKTPKTFREVFLWNTCEQLLIYLHNWSEAYSEPSQKFLMKILKK